MAYDSSKGIISNNDPVDIVDVKMALGSSSNSIVSLCTDSTRIKKMSRRKPFASTAKGYATTSALDTALVSASYGLNLRASAVNSPNDIINTSGTFAAKDWTWTLPNTTSHGKRIGDFRGYYNNPQDPIICCTYPDETIVVDSVREDGNFSVPFYIFQKTGRFAKRLPDPTHGMSSATYSRSEEQLRASLSFDQHGSEGYLVPSSTIGNIYSSNKGSAYFGLAVFQSNRTFVRFVPCAKRTTVGSTEVWQPVPITIPAEGGTYDVEMYQLNSDVLKATGLAGQYKAVACVCVGDVGNVVATSGGGGLVIGGGEDPGQGSSSSDNTALYYFPLQKYSDATNNFRHTFNLNVGGLDFYPYEYVGLSSSSTGSNPSKYNFTTSDPQCYIVIKFYNNSGKTLTISTSSLTKWKLRCKVSRTVTAQGQTTTSTQTDNKSLVYPTTGFTIANGGYQTMVFQSVPLWSSGSSVTIDSGTATFSFDGTTSKDNYLYFQALSNAFPYKLSGVNDYLQATYSAI